MTVDINGAIADWITNVIEELGDPSALDSHAQSLGSTAAVLRDTHAQLAAQVSAVPWSGPAAEAHSDAWQQHQELAEQTASTLDAASQQVGAHAQRAWAIVREVIGLLLEIAEQLAIGAALTWALSWISDLIWLRVAPLITRVLELMASFRALLGDFAQAMRDLGSLAGKVGEQIEKLILDYAPAYSRAYAGFYISEALPQLMSGGPVNWRANAWQLAAFIGLDAGFNLAEDLILEVVEGSGGAGLGGDLLRLPGQEVLPGGLSEDLVREVPVGEAGAVARVEAVEAVEPVPAVDDARIVTDGAGAQDHVLAPAGEDLDPLRLNQPQEVLAGHEGVAGVGEGGGAEAVVALGEGSGGAGLGGDLLRVPGQEVLPGGLSEDLVREVPVGEAGAVARVEAVEAVEPVPAVDDARIVTDGAGAQDHALAPAGEDLDPLRLNQPQEVLAGHEGGAGVGEGGGAEAVVALGEGSGGAGLGGDLLGLPGQEVLPGGLSEDLVREVPVGEAGAVARVEAVEAVEPVPAVDDARIVTDGAGAQDHVPAPAGEDLDPLRLNQPQAAPEAVAPDIPPDHGAPADVPRGQQTWKSFHAKTKSESLYAGLREGVNIALGNVGTDGIIEKVEGHHVSAEQFGLDFVLGGVMGGTRQALFHSLPFGERFSYRNQPEGAPAIQRWVASIPISWSYYAMYLTLKGAVKNAITGVPTPTELNPSHGKKSA